MDKSIFALDEKHPLLSINLGSLVIIGLWPLQSFKFSKNKFIRTWHYIYGFIIYIVFVIFVISEYLELINVWGNLKAMTTNMTVTFLYTVGILKIYVFLSNTKKLKSLVQDVSLIENRILQSQSDENKSILTMYVKRARRVTYPFWFLVGFMMAVFIIIPPTEYVFSSNYHKRFSNGTEYWSHKKPTIFSSWFPFDKHTYPNYIIAYLYHITVGIIGSAYQGVWDMMIISMMIHSVGQLQILQNSFINSTRSVGKQKVAKNTADKIKHMRLVDCVNHHRYIIKYIRTLNEIISPVMILYFLICSLILCTILFQVTLQSLSYQMFLILECLAVLTQLLLFYWHANEVLVEKEKLRMATYSCEWFNENERFKKSLWIIREGVKVPIKFTVGKFYIISLPTFFAIIRTSYSYFTLLRKLQETS